MAVESIAKTLGSGSGIDVSSLVTSLVDAQFSVKSKQLDSRAEKLEAQISGVSTLKNTLTSFDAALKSLVTGGSLQSRIASSNESVLKATSTDGGPAAGVSASLQVAGLASAQVSTTNMPVPADTRFRTGSLTLRLGRDLTDASGTVTGFSASGSALAIRIDEADATLAGIAARINTAGAGVTARVVADGTGERLSIRGASGAAQAFELEAADDGAATGESLSAFTVNRQAAETSTALRARDAVVLVDGVRFNRTGNVITDLVPGVKLELLGASDAPVTVAATRPTEGLKSAVNDFVAAFNEAFGIVRELNDPVSGSLNADGAVEAAARALARLSTQPLIPAGAPGAPRTLADLGVATARDGTLSVDANRLAKALATHPTEVERMFAPGAAEGDGLSGALGGLVRRATGALTGLGASASTYGGRKAELEKARAKATEQADAMRERLTRQFAGMDARVAAYKSTQTFLDNQIKAWNRSDA